MNVRWAILAGLTGLVGTLSAAEYQVAPDGDDRSAGTAQRPFRTVARGLAAASVPGDTVTVRGGTYVLTRGLNLNQPGAEGRPITLRAFPGEEVVIDGRDTSEGTSLIAVATHHVCVRGLTLRNATDVGISVWGLGSRVHDVEVTGNTVESCRKSGIFAAFNRMDDPVRDILFASNTVHHCSLMNQHEPRKAWSFGLGAGPSVRVTLRGNRVFQNYGEGVGFYLSDQGVAEGNVIHDNYSVNLYLDNTTNTRVSGNLVYSTGDSDFFRFHQPASGIQVANENYGGFSNPSGGNVIVNNLLVGNYFAFYYGNYQRGGGLRDTVFAHNTCCHSTGPLLHIDSDQAHRNSRIVNNIFVQSRGGRLTDIEGPTSHIEFRSNLWQGGNPQEAAQGRGDVRGDPGFAREGAFDPGAYRLSPDSPARSAGALMREAGVDFGGNPRGSRVNLGAWE